MNGRSQRIEVDSEFVSEVRSRDGSEEVDRSTSDNPESLQIDGDGIEARANSSGKYWAANVAGERTLADRAYAAIYSAILEGTFRPGDRLRIEDLSATLQISPTPIREALNRLEAVGLAHHVPHRGSRVSTISASEFKELYELRFILEPLAVSKAAQRFSTEEANEARQHLDRLNTALEHNQFPEAWQFHGAFHFTLYHAAQSPWLERLITPLWDSCRRYRMVQNNLRANPAENALEHQRILQACIAHDAETASLDLYNHTARNANLISQAAFGQKFFKLRA